jgi:spore coat polysaccharide biosynthesis protein SpsF
MITAIIQARMGSTRLPGKVLRTVNGRTLLDIQLERVKASKLINQIVVATSALEQDKPIADLCVKLGVACFRGSETDVLERFYQAAKQFGASTIVRLTADCPLIDPAIIDKTVALFQNEKVDYAANTVPPATSRFPDGSDVEVFSVAALERAHKEATDTQDREHVTFYFWKHGHNFKTTQLLQPENWASYRLTVDYPEDLLVVEYLLNRLAEKKSFGHVPELVAELDKHPEIRKTNSQHFSGEGWNKPAK